MNPNLRSIALLMIVAAVAMGAARLCSTQLLNEPSVHMGEGNPKGRPWPTTRPLPMPTFGSNDRARWATVRSLVEQGTYAVGKREFRSVKDPSTGDEKTSFVDTGLIFEDGWKTIDRVLHPQSAEFFSSKPPLLPTLVAGLYWLLHVVFGWTFAEQPFAIVRIILTAINVAPFFVYLWLLDGWIARFARHDWTRFAVLTVAAFGTLVTPFLIAFNNHTIGTFSVFFALDAVMKVWLAERDGRKPAWHWFVAAGFFSAFAVVNEMPALALAVPLLGVLLWRSPGATLMLALPLVLVVTAAFFVTNHLAIGQWRPAYSEFGSEWYEYEGSHWRKPPPGEIKYGIDWAKHHESRGIYAFHVLAGHHGLFSLSPIWLFAVAGSLIGIGALFSSKTSDADTGPTLPWFLPPLTAIVTVVVIAFYLVKSDNYGGWSNGLRWLMWLTPLWLLVMTPILDRLSTCKLGRGLVYLAAAVSVFSAHYSLWNPWRHPWIYDLMISLGWPGYGR